MPPPPRAGGGNGRAGLSASAGTRAGTKRHGGSGGAVTEDASRRRRAVFFAARLMWTWARACAPAGDAVCEAWAAPYAARFKGRDRGSGEDSSGEAGTPPPRLWAMKG
jgi:hypothetical protein